MMARIRARMGASQQGQAWMSDERTALRRQLRTARRAITAGERIAAAERLAGRLLHLPFAPQTGHVAGYWAMDGEIALHAWQMRLPEGCTSFIIGPVAACARHKATRW